MRLSKVTGALSGFFTSGLVALLLVGQVQGAAPVPPVEQIAAQVDVTGRLIPHGKYVALALDVTNSNPQSGLIFNDTDVELVDAAGVAQTTDPLHPILIIRTQRMLFESNRQAFYPGLHMLENTVQAGDTLRGIGIFKKGAYVKGRVKMHYWLPDIDARPLVVKEFALTGF